jgi:sigma-70, region 4
MTRDQKKETERLYEVEEMSYRVIARELALPKSTVSSHIMRTRVKKNDVSIKDDKRRTFCLYCGKKINQTKGKREKRFCEKRCTDLQ